MQSRNIETLPPEEQNALHELEGIVKREIRFSINNRRITKLMLREVILSSLPPSFQSFSELEHLDLGFNNLKVLPAAVCKLKKLRILNLGYNYLKELPQEFGELTNLEEVDLSNNFLVDLPDTMRNQQSLKKILLSSNKFTEVPKEIGDLRNLILLDISNNPLNRLPTVLEKLDNLKKLKINKFDLFPEVPERYQSDVILDLCQDRQNKILYWRELMEREVVEKLYSWSLALVFVNTNPDECETIGIGGVQRFQLNDRKKNSMKVRCEIKAHQSNFIMLPLIQSIVVRFESDLGDCQNVTFTNFLFKNAGDVFNPLTNRKVFWDEAVFKIDPAYSTKPLAELTITDVTINYRDDLLLHLEKDPLEESKLAKQVLIQQKLLLEMVYKGDMKELLNRRQDWSGRWKGRGTQGDHIFLFTIDLKHKDDRILGRITDEFGDSKLQDGQYDPTTGKLEFLKSYHAGKSDGANFKYEGILHPEQKTVEGRWFQPSYPDNEGDFKIILQDDEQNEENVEIMHYQDRLFRAFKDAFRMPTFSCVQLKIGKSRSALGKYIETLQPALVFLGILPPVVVFGINLFGSLANIPEIAAINTIKLFDISIAQWVSYLPAGLIFIILSIKFIRDGRIRKIAKKVIHYDFEPRDLNKV
jgi:hypothetical protein